MENLTDKTVLITGASKGIGLAVARRLAKEGYRLLLTYGHDHEAAEKACTLCLQDGASDVQIIQADGTDLRTIETVEQAVRQHTEGLSGLILNTGITCRSPFEEISYEDWSQVFVANVHYPTFLLQRLLPLLQKGSAVIFTGSMMAVQPHGMALPYGVSKSAVHALVHNLVKHLEPYGVRVCGVAPGFVDTDWQKGKPEAIRKNIERKVAVHRFALPEEIAEAYLFLLQNNYCNGEILQLSGGYAYA
ncbi:SDR family NAD(P)-dependent oxidoreductase [Porphyromonas crevioricanis]|uniref:Short-chain dehydrogenase n=1 Tax=Porphyromonas crevioricanis TaxID=393921 RepID=A0AB34PH18_9PORP|nr:SDR family oxidoreductase [Porphyromonas crevioricanis]KGN96340.1 short-chain dehydrogenase [Porphyromonas crevioricanis]